MNDKQRKAMFAKSKQISKSIGGKSHKETPELYQKLEEINRDVPTPKLVKVGTVFRDDPNAIQKQELKVKNFEEEQDYWKNITKEPQRSYSHTLGDARWWALSNTSTNLREAKKKLHKLESDKKEGTTLQRNTTFKDGKKRFFYTKHDSEGKQIET